MTFRKRPEERDTLGNMSKPIEASIVVVDDEPSIRELLVASLHFAGFEVNTAASGSEAIEVIEKCSLISSCWTSCCLTSMDSPSPVASARKALTPCAVSHRS